MKESMVIIIFVYPYIAFIPFFVFVLLGATGRLYSLERKRNILANSKYKAFFVTVSSGNRPH